MVFSQNSRPGAITIVLWASITFLLAGCNLDFINGTTDDETDNGCRTTYVTEDTDGDGQIDRKTATDCNDILLWGEEYRYDSSGNRIGIRRYRPSSGEIPWGSEVLSEIVSTTLYDWNNDGNQTLIASYRPNNSSHDLRYYTRTSHAADRPLIEANYVPGTAEDELQWYEVHEFAADLETYRARFSGDGLGQWLYSYEYDNRDRIELTTAYDAMDTSGSTIAATTNVTSASTLSATPWAFGVGLPEPLAAFPDMPDLSSDPAEFNLELLWTQRYWYTSSGSISMRYDPDFKPLLMNFEDSSLDESIKIAISYNAANLPASKVTSYGNTEALRLEFTYTDNLLISRLATSGAGLLIPLEYEIDYTGDNVPSRISINRDDTLLQYFEYEYLDEDIDVPTSVDDLFDPIGFGGRVATITQFDGDEQEIGHYVFSYDIGPTNNVRIDAWEHDTESNTDVPSGYFFIAKDDDGNTVSFSSYAAPEDGEDEGERIWHYAYNYDALGNRIAETRYNEDDIPTVPTGFDWELLFE